MFNFNFLCSKFFFDELQIYVIAISNYDKKQRLESDCSCVCSICGNRKAIALLQFSSKQEESKNYKQSGYKL